jgi:hypothetical protein
VAGELVVGLVRVLRVVFGFVDLDGWKNGWFWFVWSGF